MAESGSCVETHREGATEAPGRGAGLTSRNLRFQAASVETGRSRPQRAVDRSTPENLTFAKRRARRGRLHASPPVQRRVAEVATRRSRSIWDIHGAELTATKRPTDNESSESRRRHGWVSLDRYAGRAFKSGRPMSSRGPHRVTSNSDRPAAQNLLPRPESRHTCMCLTIPASTRAQRMVQRRPARRCRIRGQRAGSGGRKRQASISRPSSAGIHRRSVGVGC